MHYHEATMIDPLLALTLREPRSVDLVRVESGPSLIRQIYVAQKDGVPLYTAEVTLWGSGAGMEVISAEALSSKEAIFECTRRLAELLAKENGGSTKGRSRTQAGSSVREPVVNHG